MKLGLFLLSIVLNYCSLAADLVHLNPFHTFFEDQQTQQKMLSITSVLHNEQDELLGFHFAIYRQDRHYQVLASIDDLAQHKIIWQETITVDVDHLNEESDHLGSFFWNYSPINSTLIIGFNDHQHQHLHLKFDLLEPTNITPASRLTKYLKLKQAWSGQMNGHITVDRKEEFVTSQAAWLQEIWQNSKDQNHHEFKELLCKFEDGESLYAIQVHELDALKAANVGRYNALGQKQNISQFINLVLDKTQEISIPLGKPSDKMQLFPLGQLPHTAVFSAKMLASNTLGLCIFQTNPWKTLSQMQLPAPIHDSFLKKTLAFSQKPFKIPVNLKNKFTS